MKRYQQNLCSKLQSKPGRRLTMEEVQKYGKQICIAVAELHAQNIVVADLKPQNILIDEYDNCVVADFGISTILSHGMEHRMSDGLHGTFNYMSPEAFDPETFGGVTTQTDAWSFACCIVEMVSGKRPWDNTSMSAICYKIATARESPTVPASLPRLVRDTLIACFSYDRIDRPSFPEIYRVFEKPWNLVGSASISLDGQQPEGSMPAHNVAQLVAQLRALEAEKEAWERERGELTREKQKFAMRLVKQDKELERQGAVCKQLHDQLQLVLDSLKEQQQQKRDARENASSSHNNIMNNAGTVYSTGSSGSSSSSSGITSIGSGPGCPNCGRSETLCAQVCTHKCCEWLSKARNERSILFVFSLGRNLTLVSQRQMRKQKNNA